MDVSSSTSADMGSVQVEALKKSIDVAQRATLKVLESATEQAQQVTAQKTGMGKNINLTA